MKFTGSFYTTSTLTCKMEGFTFTARMEGDMDADHPWEQDDGHGPVSEWTRRDKTPGEVILHSDGSARRYYDMQEAVKIALRDGWGLDPNVPLLKTGATKGQIAAEAARRDYEHLKAYCEGRWHYCGVVISVSRNGITLDNNAYALWGLETDNADYLNEAANDLLGEALQVARELLIRVNA